MHRPDLRPEELGPDDLLLQPRALLRLDVLRPRPLAPRRPRRRPTGDAQKVVLEYERFLAAKDGVREAASAVPDGAGTAREDPRRRGSSTATALERTEFAPGDAWAAEIEFAVDDPARPVQLHLAVSTPDNIVCFTADSRLDGAGPFSGRSRQRVRISVDRRFPLGKGEFVVFAYVGDETSLALYDARSDVRFRVESPVWRNGLMRVDVRWDAVG